MSLSCSVIFSADFGYICLFHELLILANDTLFSILIGLLSVPLLPLCWLSIAPIECLMEYIRKPPAILQTHKENVLVVMEHHEYARLGCICGLHIGSCVNFACNNFYLQAIFICLLFFYCHPISCAFQQTIQYSLCFPSSFTGQ